MATKSKSPEVMAPAGDFICLDAALKAGADAVYFGVKGCNMRAGAKNFEIADLKKIAQKCAQFGAKSYMTLNTIYYEGEQNKIASVIRAAKRAGIDAIIAWDFAVIDMARKIGVPVYLSTQASVSNADAIAAYAVNFGIRRFVLARECGLEAIKKIRASLKRKVGVKLAREISIEVFAHGAMCVSLSGRCFLSQFSCGKSANRGECMQPCRREYLITDARDGNPAFTIGSGYVMSPKDLCTLEFLDKLIGAGVNSLKIEGRNRNAEYVFNTVDAYVRVRDFYLENKKSPNFQEEFSEFVKPFVEKLSGVFNRGFSDGFYMGKPLGQWTSHGNFATMKKVIVGHVTNFFSKVSVAEVSIDDNSISVGDEIQIEGDTTGCVRMKVESIHLKNVPVDSAKKGMIVGVKTNEKLRRTDRVYKFLPNQS